MQASSKQTPSGGIVLKKAPQKPFPKPSPIPTPKPSPIPTPKPYVVPKFPLVLAPQNAPNSQKSPASPSISSSLGTKPFTKPRLLWKTFVGVCNAPATGAPEGIYIATGSQVQRLDRIGHVAWARDIGLTQGAITLSANHLFVGSDAGFVFALERKTGKVFWKVAVAQGPIRNAPVVTEDQVIVESFDNLVYALEKSSGNLVWKYERKEGSFGYAGPVLAPLNNNNNNNNNNSLNGTNNKNTVEGDDMILLVAGDSLLYSLSPNLGTERWKIELGGRSLTTPAVSKGIPGRVFLSGDGIVPVAIDTQKGKRLWKASGIKTGWFGPCLLVGNTLYVANDQRYMYAINASNGQMRWQYRLLGGSQSRPTLDTETNTLYVSSVTFRDNPTLTALEANTGGKLWEYKLGYLSASPIIEDGVLYIGSTNGNFYAFGLH